MLIGASQPFGTTRKLSYTMTPDRYTGRVLYVTFRTDADLAAWVPPPLEPVDPHEGFIKIYELKRRPEHGEALPPNFSQYNEVCVTVLAAPPGEPARHYNIFMWVDHDWALYKAREAFGWPKKLADIHLTATYPGDDRYDLDDGTTRFNADMSRWGYQVMKVRAELDPAAPAQPSPPFNGFYTARHIPGPVGGEEISEILVIETRDGWFRGGTFGTATVEFGDAPDEELTQLGRIEVTGCVLREVGWVLPGSPARRIGPLAPFGSGTQNTKEKT
ncbi:MAG: acetoacetate decarboxylase family protein [Acidimicrobiia bacterium]|nr:acetoacetate decarboxylase family protein [Acidimicrobiia bacterium]